MKRAAVLSAMMLLAAASLQAATVRYGTNVSAYDRLNPTTYTEITSATWAQLNTALTNAQNSSTRGFVYVSGDIPGSGSLTGPLRIVLNTGTVGFEFKGAWKSDFSAQDYTTLSVLSANASYSSQSRVLVIGADNVRVDGFEIRGGYSQNGNDAELSFAVNNAAGGGIAAHCAGLHLSHLRVTANTGLGGWSQGGGICFHPRTTASSNLFEYLDISGNTMTAGGDAAVYGGGMYIGRGQGSATDAKMLFALCAITGNTATATGPNYYGNGAGFFATGPGRVTDGISHWTFFGVLVAGNKNNTLASSCFSTGGNGGTGSRQGWSVMANCTFVDNRPINIGNEGGVANYQRGVVYLNSAISENHTGGSAGATISPTYSYMNFKNCAIDEISSAGDSATNGFFGVAGTGTFIDLGDCLQITNVVFRNQPIADYRLGLGSPAIGAAEALYSSAGAGFAYVDIDRDGGYDAGTDVIIDITQASGQYVPSANEYYYPKDMLGERWLSIGRYSSSSNLVGKISAGAYAPRSMRGMVITLR